MLSAQFGAVHIIMLLFLSIVPIVVIIAGIKLLINGILVTFSIVFSYFILPIIAVLLFAVVIIKVRKLSVNVVLTMLILSVFLIIFLFMYVFQSYEALNLYENEKIEIHYAENTNEQMPALSEISNHEKLEYYHYEGYGFIFEWDAKALICKYSENEYLQQKALLEKKYIFQTDAIYDDEYVCKPATEIEGYAFRMLSAEAYEMYYPKEVVLIATNDEANEIVYLCYSDEDIDYIDSLEEFILDECGWEHIR